MQAPHIAVAIFARGLLKQLFTRIYFADVKDNEADPLLLSIDDPARRETIIAARLPGIEPPSYRFDIVLRGERETVFLDL